jgi:hypothetical protein
MKRLLRVLNEFWFPEVPAARLAMLRILIGGWAFCLVAADYSLWVGIGRSSPVLFHPVGVAAFLSHPIPAVWNQALIIATVLASVLFVLGWRHRIIGPVFAALLLWVLCYRQSWSMIYHSMNLPVLHILVLGLAPAADALSLDARRKRVAQGGQDPPSGWQYGFPIQLICAVTVLGYFVTGVAKVAGPLGWSWVTGEALRSQVAADTIRKEVLGEVGSPLFFWLYGQAWLFTMMGIHTMIVELGAPLALLNKRVGRAWACLAFVMHWGILFLMKITFRYHLSGILYASFFDVERIPVWIRELYARRTARLVAAQTPATR